MNEEDRMLILPINVGHECQILMENSDHLDECRRNSFQNWILEPWRQIDPDWSRKNSGILFEQLEETIESRNLCCFRWQSLDCLTDAVHRHCFLSFDFRNNREMKKSPNGRLLQRFIPARVLFVILSSLGFFLVYAYKVVISMAIVAMVKTANHTTSTSISTADSCPGVKASSNVNEGELDWTNEEKNWVLASFFYGYVLTQIPAGILANRFGGKWIFGISMFIASLCSLLGPAAARKNSTLFVVTRVVQGLCEGVAFPCMNGMIAQWMPKMERSRGTTIIYTGSMFGTVVTLPMAAQFNSSAWGWSASFYVLGFIGVVWFALFSVLVFESPEQHPFISQKEHDFIIENGGGKRKDIV